MTIENKSRAKHLLMRMLMIDSQVAPIKPLGKKQLKRVVFIGKQITKLRRELDRLWTKVQCRK